jgi:hypothetical protein
VDIDDVTPKFENGVPFIRISKTAEGQARTIEVA